MDESERLPPGQGATTAWPVLHFGTVPAFDPAGWDLVVRGAVERELRFTWDEVQALPRREVVADFHCVTRWSHLDARWEGVPLAEFLERAGVRPDARFVRFADGEAYDTTIPLSVAQREDVLLADREAGEALPPPRGGPLRAVVPSLYGWKSCKWLRVVELLTEDRLGFWESRGYANGADPWREERLV